MDIRGKRALVTGAASGIGRATAVALATKGAQTVAVADIDADGLRETAALVEQRGARALAIATDVSSIESMRALFGTIEREARGLDILHNNAGLVTGTPQYPDMTLERVAALVDVNIKAVMLGTSLGIPLLAKEGGGVVVNTASVAAQSPMGAEAIYNTTKAAIVFFTRCCADFKDTYGVRCSCVCPGMVDTPMLAKTGDGTKPADWLAPFLPMVQLIPAEDVAMLVIDLIEDDTKNGEVATLENKPVR